MILLATLLAAQSMSTDGKDMKPASVAAIVAGGKACLGATVDPVGEDARLAGWTELDAGQRKKAGVKTEGRAVTRDNVMIAYKPGVEGGCVVMAQTGPGFDKAALLAQLSVAAGTTIGADPNNPVTMLPDGELMVTQIGADEKDGGVMLVVASQKNSHVQGKAHTPPSPQPQGK